MQVKISVKNKKKHENDFSYFGSRARFCLGGLYKSRKNTNFFNSKCVEKNLFGDNWRKVRKDVCEIIEEEREKIRKRERIRMS